MTARLCPDCGAIRVGGVCRVCAAHPTPPPCACTSCTTWNRLVQQWKEAGL